MNRRTVLPVRALLSVLTVAGIFAATAVGAQGAAPTDPANVSAVAGPGYIAIQWEHGGAGVESFEVLRAAAGAPAAPQRVGVVDATQRNYLDRSVAIGSDYTYSVVASGAGGSSQPGPQASEPTSAAPGVAIRTGVYDHTPGQDAITYIAIYLSLPDEVLASGPWNATITGPRGWNNDAPFDIPLSADMARADRFIGFGRSRPAVSGNYRLDVTVGSTVYSATTRLNGTNAIPRIGSYTVATARPDLVEVTWNQPRGASHYSTSLYQGTGANAVLVATVYSQTTRATFADLALAPGTYSIRHLSASFDQSATPPELHDGAYSMTINRSQDLEVRAP